MCVSLWRIGKQANNNKSKHFPLEAGSGEKGLVIAQRTQRISKLARSAVHEGEEDWDLGFDVMKASHCFTTVI